MKMVRIFLYFLLGYVVGGLTWPVSSMLIVGHFLPHDSGSGLLVAQVIMTLIAIYVSFKYDFITLSFLTLGFFVGFNTLPYLFNSTEMKGWYFVAMIASLCFIVIPFLLGVGAILTNISIRRGK